MKLLSNVFLLTLFVSIMSCSESTFEPQDLEKGFEYYPLAVGNEWVYRIDSTIYLQDGNLILRDSAQIKEEITDKLDEDIFIITKSTRKTADKPWQIIDTYTAENDGERLFKTENNRRFIKLVFPIRDNKQWDGNVHFDSDSDVDVFGNMLPIFENWEYEIESNDSPVTILDNSYSDVITVEQSDFDFGIDYSRNYEQYAKGIGLIFRQNSFLSSQDKGPDQTWEEAAQEGYITTYQLISFK